MKKSEWIRGLMASLQAGPDEAVFFGDTLEDWQSSQEAGCGFVGVANEELAGKGVPFIKDFNQLRSLV